MEAKEDLHRREFFTIPQLADYYGLGVRLIRDSLKNAEHPLPHFKLNSKTKIVARADFHSWLEKYRLDPASGIDDIVDKVLGDLT